MRRSGFCHRRPKASGDTEAAAARDPHELTVTQRVDEADYGDGYVIKSYGEQGVPSYPPEPE